MKGSYFSRGANSLAREFAVQFLYQCEREKLTSFPEANFTEFVNHFGVPLTARAYTRELVMGTMAQMPVIDAKLTEISKNWSLHRMVAVDRCVLRMASYELAQAVVPRKVIINEAIDLAKKFGSENSGSFVNGILDKLGTEFSPPPSLPIDEGVNTVGR